MNHAIRTFIASLAVATGLISSAHTATAADYTLVDVVNARSSRAALEDKNLRLYENVKEVNQGRDGWCYVPGNKNHRNSSWSCTVRSTSFTVPNERITGVKLQTYSDGDRVKVNGRAAIARKTRPASGDFPYCDYIDLRKEGVDYVYHVYLCAYFIYL